ncbi:hypothetical protein [Kribbella endophytica]
MASWKGDLVKALTALGGEGSLSEIYGEIARIHKPLSTAWQATVRNTLECHSSDSENFRGREDLFYSVGGIGRGRWGLR